MRKKLFLILLAVLTLSGCRIEDRMEVDERADGGLAVTFGTATPTRAFFDGDPAGEPWEREIHTLEAILCNEGGHVLHRRQLTPTEIESGKALFIDIQSTENEQYTVYLFANYDASEISGGFEFLTDAPVTKYNGSYEQLRQECADPGGFAMAAVGTLTPAHTYQNPLHLTLMRTVSKLELKITIGDNLNSYHPNGELEVTETGINFIAQKIPLFGEAAGADETSLFQTPFEQVPNREYNNVFYLFSHETLVPEITLMARFYPDGKTTNPENYSEHTFSFSPEGTIEPNIYYRLSAHIANLDEIIVPTTYTVTYHPNGGTGSNYSGSAEEGDYYVLHPTAASIYPPDYDYQLYEWNTKADGTGSSFPAQQWVQLNADLDLYAIWRPNFRITAAPAFSDNYLQYGKLYEVVYTVTPWPDVTETFNYFQAGWGWSPGKEYDGHYLDITFPSARNRIYSADISASGTFSVWFSYTAPIFTHINCKPSFTFVFQTYYHYSDQYDTRESYTYQWMPKAKNQLEIVTRWQSEDLRCTAASSNAYTSYQTGESSNDWEVYYCDEDGFMLTAVPDAGYRFEGWYLDSEYTQMYSTLRTLDYVPTQSVFRLFPRVIKDEI